MSGRNAFRRASGRDLVKDLEHLDFDELRRQQFAMRSFTESVELDDLPPPPQANYIDEHNAPSGSRENRMRSQPSRWSQDFADDVEFGRRDSAASGTYLNGENEDLDRSSWEGRGMRTSSTQDTIIEMKLTEIAHQTPMDTTLGETQKYIMSVPGPGHVDQEFELHQSLLRKASDSAGNATDTSPTAVAHDSMDELDQVAKSLKKIEENTIARLTGAISPREEQDETVTLSREELTRIAMQRPRPTTPTSWSVIETYVEQKAEIASDPEKSTEAAFIPVSARMPPDSGARMRVMLPGQRPSTSRDGTSSSGVGQFRRRTSSMSWSEFYEQMEQPPQQTRSKSSMLDNADNDSDLLENNPVYARKAPPKPVEHRRSSVDWENFERHPDEEEIHTELRRQTITAMDEYGKTPDATWNDTGSPSKFRRVDEDQINHFEQQYYSANATGQSSEMNPFAVGEPTNNETEYPSDPSINPYSSTSIGETTTTAGIAPVRAAPPPPPSAAAVPPSQEYADTQNYAADYATDTNWQPTDPNPYTGAAYSDIYSGYDQDNQAINGNPYAYNYDHQVPEQVATEAYGYDYGAQFGSGTAEYDYSAYATNQYGSYVDAGHYETTQQPQYDTTGAGYEAYGQYSAAATDYGASASDTQQYDSTNPYASDYNATTAAYDYASSNDPFAVQITATDAHGSGFDYNQDASEPLPPASTFLSQPLLPQQRSRTPDPFSWEAQETAYAQHGSAVVPPAPPRPAPPITPARTPVPDSSEDESTKVPIVQELGAANSEVQEATEKSAPPPRPAAPPVRPPAPSPQPVRPPPPSLTGSPYVERKPVVTTEEKEEEEDPWAKFKQMTEQVSSVVRNTTEQLSKLSEKSAADDIKDESYLAHIGGSQGFQLNTAQKQILQMQEEQKKAKVDKKKRGKKPPSPTYDPNREQDLEKAAAELVKKMAATRADLADWRPPGASEDAIEPEKEELQKPEIEGASDEGPIKALKEIENREPQPVENFADFAAANITSSQVPPDWAGFGDDSAGPPLPSSESDFFQKILQAKEKTTQGEDSGFGFDFSAESAPDAGAGATVDPFAPMNAEPSLINSTFDPFDTRPAEEIIAEAKQRAEYEHAKLETDQDLEFFAAQGSSPTAKTAMSASRLSTPTEMGSPASTAAAARPTGFEDDFKAEAGEYSHTPTPLYDEDDTLPLADFPDKFTGEGWELMLRHPLKKKIMADRYWKPCYVRLDGNMLLIYSSKQESKPFQEILLQASYSLSDTTLQAYDIYGKIHTVKLQHILYKERVGIRPGQISRLVEGHVTKYGLPLEHAAQATVLAKFGSLNGDDLATFVHCVEDLLFHCSAKRETTPVYKQDEVQVHCYDEYTAHIDRDGNVSNQRARVRLFCLTFLSGSPYIEIGLNDRRRQGKEIVRRKDILPMYTERWIRFEKLEFHNTVDQKVFEEDQVIKIQPPDGCFFEVMRFRIRPPKSREKPLSVKCLMRMAGSKIEIRIDAMANVHQQRAKGTTESTRTIPCEDIQIRFPIPEAWIYIFREERHWGVGSVHSKMRKPGKVKNLKDRLMGAVQHTEQTLIEVAIGEAKYEHLYRSLVWRIPRLPEKTQAAYKTHMLKCRFELSSFDLMPEAFLPQSELEFTMPLATISNTVVRSVSVEQHEDSDRVEKFVRYVAKCHYTVDVDYVQCHDLDDVEPNAAVIPSAENDELSQPKHVAAFNPETVQQQHEGYRIDLPENDGFGFKNYGGENGGGAVGSGLDMSGNGGIGAVGGVESSSDDEDVSHKVPMVEINMQGYGY